MSEEDAGLTIDALIGALKREAFNGFLRGLVYADSMAESNPDKVKAAFAYAAGREASLRGTDAQRESFSRHNISTGDPRLD